MNATGHQMITVAAGGLRLRCRVEGPAHGEAVVLAHGLLSDHTMWDWVAGPLSRTHRVVRFDLRGHGASDAAPAPYAMNNLVDDVVTLLDTLQIARAHFVGISLGGMIGQALASRHGDRLLSLTIANATATQTAAAMWQGRIDLARREGVPALAPATLERWFSPTFRARRPDVIARLQRTIEATSMEGFVGCAGVVRDLNQAALLPMINTPTLVITGEDDRAIAPAQSNLIAARIGDAVLTLIPQSGHLCAVDQPGVFLRALQAFLRQHPAAHSRSH